MVIFVMFCPKISMQEGKYLHKSAQNETLVNFPIVSLSVIWQPGFDIRSALS